MWRRDDCDHEANLANPRMAGLSPWKIEVYSQMNGEDTELFTSDEVFNIRRNRNI